MSNADDAATNFGIIARHTTELLIAMSLEITRRVAGCVSDQEIMVRAVEDITKDNVDKQLMSLAYVKWARSQFPIIKVGHKLAAALMTSRFDVDLEVKHPWDCFMIDVPDGLIDTVGVLGNSVVIKKIMAFHIDRAVTARGGSWAYVAFASDLTALWRYGYTASGMTQTIEERDDADFFVRMDCIDLKVADLIGRLVIGVACMITNAREVES